MKTLTLRLKGGPGSGFFDHAGRPGFIGGSMAADKGGGGISTGGTSTGGRKKFVLPPDMFDKLLDAGTADIKYAATHRDIESMRQMLATASLSTPKRKANAELLRSLIGGEAPASKPAAAKVDTQAAFDAAKAASKAAHTRVTEAREKYGMGSPQERQARDALQSANIAYNEARAAHLQAGGSTKPVKNDVQSKPVVSTELKIGQAVYYTDARGNTREATFNGLTSSGSATITMDNGRSSERSLDTLRTTYADTKSVKAAGGIGAPDAAPTNTLADPAARRAAAVAQASVPSQDQGAVEPVRRRGRMAAPKITVSPGDKLSSRQFYDMEEDLKKGKIGEFYKGKFAKRPYTNNNRYKIYEYTDEDGVIYAVSASHMTGMQMAGRLRIPSGTTYTVKMNISRTEPGGGWHNTANIYILGMTRRGEGPQSEGPIRRQMDKMKEYAKNVFGIDNFEIN